MKDYAEKYYNNLFAGLSAVKVTDKHKNGLDFYQGIEAACGLIQSQAESGCKLMFIGNGASAAISSHMAADYLKNGGLNTVTFNNSSLLTCMGNDYGYEHVFEKPIEISAQKGDVLIAISSSGKSENILLAVDAAKNKRCAVLTLSGFDPDNPLSSLGDINFYVPVKSYGIVEIVHHSICHCILDTIVRFSKSQILELSKVSSPKIKWSFK